MTKSTSSVVSDDWTIPVSEDGLLFMAADVDPSVHDVTSNDGEIWTGVTQDARAR